MRVARLLNPVRTVERGGPHLVFEELQSVGLVVSYQTVDDPTDAEWERWLDAADSLLEKVGHMRLLVVTDGGRPNGKQIERLRVRKRGNPLTSIVSPSMTLRFVVSAVGLLNPAVRCFTPDQRTGAYAHLGLTPIEQRFVEAALARLRGQVGGPPKDPPQRRE